MNDLTSLTNALKVHGLKVHLETSGVYPISGQIDWITFSPKPHTIPNAIACQLANELKVVIQKESYFDFAESMAQKTPSAVRFLQPEWNTPSIAQKVFSYVLEHPQWSVSLQTHKYLKVH